MKIKAFLILILIFIIGLDFYFILFSQPFYQNNVEQIEYIEVNDKINLFEEIEEKNNTTYELQTLDEDFNNYLCGPELGCFKIILNTFNKNIELKEISSNYFEGKMHPHIFYLFVKKYNEENNYPITIKDISRISIDDLEKICKNGWLTQCWYCENMDLNINKHLRWQNANVGIIYKIEEDTVYILDAINGFKEFSKEDFENMWQYCGNYAILYR